MLNVLKARWHQGYRTIPYPRTAPSLPDRFRGVPQVRFSLCPESCCACMAACPTGAVGMDDHGKRSIDLGRCLFCGRVLRGLPGRGHCVYHGSSTGGARAAGSAPA